MKKKLRVLMVVFNLSVANGVSSFIMNYFRKLNHDAVAMDFVVYQDTESPYYDEIRIQGSQIYHIPSIRHFKEHMKVCYQILSEGQYDIVHDNILILSTGLMHCAKKLGVPVRILHSHNAKLGTNRYKKMRNRMFLPLLVKQVNSYFACSDLAADCMFGKRAYTFIPNVVDGQKFEFHQSTRNRIRTAMNVSDKLVIVTVGRLVGQKNPFYAIDVISELFKLNKKIEYWWVGSGPLEESVKEYIQKKNASGYVHLLGRRTDVTELYQGADVFFLPSIFEGLPVTGVEAQAAGLYCFVSDTITRQFIYTDLVKTFSIQEAPQRSAEILEQWLKTIDMNKDRAAYVNVLAKSQFSDQQAGLILESAYHDLMKAYQPQG
ncbi:MAG: Glycosyltransferase family 1 protein [Mitsuokella multacida]|jgi:glycosyltransferase involved in cell wall biosynthesis